MASAWGLSWQNAWGNSWGLMPVTTLKGGHRIPNKYVPIDLRRARWRAAKRKLDEERRQLALLKKQQAKVEIRYKAITLELPEAVQEPASADNSQLLELELREIEQRVALQAEAVKRARRDAELAKREAARLADERELQEAYEAFQRAESLRLEQEADDEMMQVLLLVHDE